MRSTTILAILALCSTEVMSTSIHRRGDDKDIVTDYIKDGTVKDIVKE